MDVSKVISDFRLLSWWTDTNQLSDANALILANKIYRDIINKIKVKVKEDFFYDYWKVDNTVVWQEEYRLPIRNDSTWVAWCTKLKGVSIMYNDTDTEYTKANPQTQANLDKDLMYYKDNQDSSQPFFIVADYSYFVYPAPTTAISDGIILYWISDPANLQSGWDEASIKIPLEYHDLLPIWMVYLYYKSRNLIAEKNDAYNEYKLSLNEMIEELSDRVEVAVTSQMPNLSHLN